MRYPTQHMTCDFHTNLIPELQFFMILILILIPIPLGLIQILIPIPGFTKINSSDSHSDSSSKWFRFWFRNLIPIPESFTTLQWQYLYQNTNTCICSYYIGPVIEAVKVTSIRPCNFLSFGFWVGWGSVKYHSFPHPTQKQKPKSHMALWLQAFPQHMRSFKYRWSWAGMYCINNLSFILSFVLGLCGHFKNQPMCLRSSLYENKGILLITNFHSGCSLGYQSLKFQLISSLTFQYAAS